MKITKKDRSLRLIGWREWVQFKHLKIKRIKAKIDTGAKTSALHVSEYSIIREGAKKYVKFRVHPVQRASFPSHWCKARLVEMRKVRSSNGQVSQRPVILATMSLNDQDHDIELTLVNRDLMGFRMLLGRDALKGVFLVHPSKSFLQSALAV